jgi:hypothetical protein
MSIATDIAVEAGLLAGLAPGSYVTFDADLMFSALRLDGDGRLWEVNGGCGEPRFEGDPGDPFPWSGHMCIHSRSRKVCLSLLFAAGTLDAVRPGANEAWDAEVTPPGMAPFSAAFFPSPWPGLDGADGGRHDEWVLLLADGLPRPDPGNAWVVATSGDLVSLPEDSLSLPGDGLWNLACRTPAASFHGWVFFDDPSGRLPRQAARFADGGMQWIVPVRRDGTARAPGGLADASPQWARQPDTRHAALAMACRILPTDYHFFGGDVVRWRSENAVHADCSGGCRWWHPLHDPDSGWGDGDWGVCGNPRSRRCGMLTFEHQAGFGCFECEPHASVGCESGSGTPAPRSG